MVAPQAPENEHSTFIMFHGLFVESVMRANGKAMGFIGLQTILRVKIRQLTAKEIIALIGELNELILLCRDYLEQHGIAIDEKES